MQYRFTQMAANVMHYSKEVAAELNHSYIGTEHILIGCCERKRDWHARCWKIMM